MAAFAYVVELESFSAAARALGLSKSAVSKQVSELERELGVQLLHRTTRQLRLTDAGRACHRQCAHIVGEAEELRRTLSSLPDEPSGLLRVTAPIDFGKRRVARTLAAFLLRYPGLQAELELRDDYVDVIGEGFDLAVRIGQLQDSTLIARKLAPMAMVLCAAPDYLARAGTPRTHADLRDHDVIRYSLSSTPGRVRLFKDGRRLHATLRGRLISNNGGAILEAVRAGLGLGLLPEFYVEEDLAAGHLTRVLADYTARGAAVYAVHPSGRHVSAKVRLFIDTLVSTIGPARPGSPAIR